MTKQFDMVVINIGYTNYVMSKAAALQFFELCVGADIYKYDSHWNGNETEYHAWPLPQDQTPSIRIIGPAQFMQAVELKKAYDEQQKQQKQKKVANA